MLVSFKRRSQGFWGTGEKGIYFRGTGEQRPNFEGNRGRKTIFGNREHKKTNRFFGNRGTSQFISGEQGNRYPPGRASLKGCQFEHTELSIHLESFNDECAIGKEAQNAYMWRLQESKLNAG